MKIFVKPREGMIILRPDTGRKLEASGEFVPKNTFWARRILDGDVVECQPPTQEVKKEQPKAEPAKKEEKKK